MSTIVYAQLTNARAAHAQAMRDPSPSTGLRTYVDSFAALVPAEVLALHAVVISHTTKSAEGGAAAMILREGLCTLQVSFWGLLVLAAILYAVPRRQNGRWDDLDWLRMLIPPLAFVGWTMLQRVTAFDAICPGLNSIPRTVGALFLGAALGVITTAMAPVGKVKPGG